MCKDELQYCFCKMFVVFYIVNLYICVFMICSTSCCLIDTLMDPWNISVCVCLQIHYVIDFYQTTLLDTRSFYIQIYTMWTQINYIKNPYIIICLSANITENCTSSKSASFFTVSSRSLIKHWFTNHIYLFFFFVIHTMHVLAFNMSFNIRTLWFTIYDIYQLLYVLALRCHPQRVIYN